MKPAYIILNTMFLAIIAAAWFEGFLVGFYHVGFIEEVLLGVIGAVFLGGQVALARQDYDHADFAAQSMPKLAISFVILAMIDLAVHVDFSDPVSRAVFIGHVIAMLGVTCAAIFGYYWLEAMVWILDDGS